jgi:hypothetical protein
MEIGHWLDHQAIGRPGVFASIESPQMAEWRKAVFNSHLTERLQDIRDAGALPWRSPSGRVLSLATGPTAEELLRSEEMLSRAYAQYVATESGNKLIQKQIDAFSAPSNPVSIVPRFWQDADFFPVASALRRVIVEAGWKAK